VIEGAEVIASEVMRNPIGRLSMSAAGITTTPPRTCETGSNPRQITVGPDKKLSFTESAVNKIGVLDLTTIQVNEWEVGGMPYGITVGHDGNLWFTEFTGSKFGHFNLTTKTVAFEALIPTADSGPYDITAGAPGDDAVWFTEKTGNKIRRLRTGVFHYPPEEFVVPTDKSEPAGITVGPDHHIWFTEGNRFGLRVRQ
jgi:virginiamycin B lyase